MSYDPARHHRRSIRLAGHDYAGGGVYFVTLCTHREAGAVFAEEASKKVAEACWRAIPEHFPQVEAGEFVAMPDHVHGIVRMVGAKRAKDVSPVQGGRRGETSFAQPCAPVRHVAHIGFRGSRIQDWCGEGPGGCQWKVHLASELL